MSDLLKITIKKVEANKCQAELCSIHPDQNSIQVIENIAFQIIMEAYRDFGPFENHPFKSKMDKWLSLMQREEVLISEEDYAAYLSKKKAIPEWKDIFAINLVANVRLNVNLRSKIFKVGQNPFECFKAYFGKKFVNNLTDEEILQLPSLKFLYLADLGIDSIPFTTYFSELELLDICLNRFDSIPFLTNFPKLKSFYAEVNKIKTITELQNLRELEELNLRENCVTSVAHLQNLEKLTYLDVGRNKIEEIAVLSGLKNVIELQIDYNEVKDCEAICQLEALNILVLNDNPVQNLEKLIALKNIHYLSIQNTSKKSEEVALFFQSKIGIENVKS